MICKAKTMREKGDRSWYIAEIGLSFVMAMGK